MTADIVEIVKYIVIGVIVVVFLTRIPFERLAFSVSNQTTTTCAQPNP